MQQMGMFGMTPQDVQAARMAEMNQSALEQARLNPMQLATYGSAMAGKQLGGVVRGLFGGQDPQEAKVLDVNKISSQIQWNNPESIMRAAQELSAKGHSREAMALMQKAQEMQKALADTDASRALAEFRRRPPAAGGVGGGTGPERMASFIAEVDAKVAAGEPVTDFDMKKADNFRQVLSQTKTYLMPDGSVVKIPIKDFGATQEVTMMGGVEVPQGTAPTTQQQPPRAGQQPSTTPQPARGGAQVVQTPASVAAAEKVAEGKRVSDIIAQSDIAQIDKALGILQENGRWAAGWGSLLKYAPETSAYNLDAAISSIDAVKLINQIQSLKTTSATGATGFGSLTEKEGQRLIDRLGALRQGMEPKVLESNLREIRELMSKLTSGTAAPETPKPPASGARKLTDSIIQQVINHPRNKGKTRAQVEAALRAQGYQ